MERHFASREPVQAGHNKPPIREEFLEEERQTLPARVYRQEYLCSFEETEDQVFGHEVVERAITPEVAPLFVGGG